MIDIELDSLVYYKTEIDEKLSNIETDYNEKIDLRSEKAHEGSPGGIATLTTDGKHTRVEIPWTNATELLDETDTDSVMNPLRTHSLIGYKSILKDEKGVPNGVANIDSNGKIPIALIPDLGSVQSFYAETVSDMLALLNVYQGDRCIVYNDPDTNNNKEYIAIVDGPNDITDWGEVPVYNAVTSVNGEVGAVVLTKYNVSDIMDNYNDIVALQADVQTNKDDISTLTSEVGAIDNDLSGLTLVVDDHETRITEIEKFAQTSGPSSSRPTSPVVGLQYYDTDLIQPIWYNGTEWTDALGNPVDTTYIVE